ncbi:murein hydrolase activator EnvC family protein [Labedella phragmitis]|uniref:murein hydrolase activator EnvC family protein n=1 Tax=Labedella phragmitis TaxID=2498849 RepID=UPI00140B8EAD|nr:M23 family metallopeptidase [Labedella phragmitis]
MISFGAAAPTAAAGGRSTSSAASPVTDRASTAVAAARADWSWPTAGRRHIVDAFDAPEHRFGAGHRGIDIAAAVGETITASANGTVIFSGPVAGRSVITVDHGGGLVSSYDPIVPNVRSGAPVSAGHVLGTLGPGHAMHCRSGCVHLGVRFEGAYVDPAPFFRPPRRSVLLPLDG